MTRTLLVAAVLVAAATARADPQPRFDPVPKFDPVPQFKTEPPAADYTACLAAVARGETVYLAVGVRHLAGDYAARSLDGVPPGRYRCWRDKGASDRMEPLAEAKAAPVVVTDDDHVCDRCGATQNVRHQTNADGSHSHKCDGCGHVWWHGGPLGYQKSPAKVTPAAPIKPYQFTPLYQPGGG